MSKIDLRQGDCLEVMKEIPSKSIDMILCDLPYGVTQNKKDIVLPFDKLWKQYNRIIKDNGCIALFGQGLFFIDLVNSNRKMYRYDLVWDKVLTSGFLNAKRMPLRQHEQIAIFYKKKPTYNPQFTIGKPLHSKGTVYKTAVMKNNNYGKFNVTEDLRVGSTEKYPTSIVRFSKPHPSIAKHPTEKSVELLKWLIKTYTNETELVLDNCMGSGSTGVACINTNRNFIGIELNENYFSVAKQRIYETKNKLQKRRLI
jgi:site-specific DNA-methyltransferase (adenine-specific)